MANVKIGGRDIPLQFNMPEFAEIESEIGAINNVNEFFLKGKNRISNIVKAIRIMGNSALADHGKPADLTNQWLYENMKPRELVAYQTAVIAAITEGMQMETEEEREHDFTLEEIDRKKEQGNFHTGE